MRMGCKRYFWPSVFQMHVSKAEATSTWLGCLVVKLRLTPRNPSIMACTIQYLRSTLANTTQPLKNTVASYVPP